MADNTTQQQKTLRKLSARISAAFRIPRQPTLLERRRIEQCSNDDNRDDNRDDNNSSTAMVTAAERTQPRRRLPRGWWPDQGKREGLKLKAMYGLQNETFVSDLLRLINAVFDLKIVRLFGTFANDVQYCLSLHSQNAGGYGRSY